MKIDELRLTFNGIPVEVRGIELDMEEFTDMLNVQSIHTSLSGIYERLYKLEQNTPVVVKPKK